MDVCLADGAGLQCRAGRAVHVLGARCADGGGRCAALVRQTLARLCEGQRSCAGLGLGAVVFADRCRTLSPLTVTFSCRQGQGTFPTARLL